MILPKGSVFGSPAYVLKLNLTEAVTVASDVMDTYAVFAPLFMLLSIFMLLMTTVSVPAVSSFNLTDSVIVSFLPFLSYFML